jgi:hypothetical protein
LHGQIKQQHRQEAEILLQLVAGHDNAGRIADKTDNTFCIAAWQSLQVIGWQKGSVQQPTCCVSLMARDEVVPVSML